MQAGLVSAPMNWSDIFTAPATLGVFFVAVVRIPPREALGGHDR